MSRSRPRRKEAARRAAPLAGLVFAASLVLHLGVALQYRADPFAETPVSDALSYHEWALRLAEHGLNGEPSFHQSPLFPLLLGSVYAVAPEQSRATWALTLQSLLNSLAFALLVPLGRRYLGSTAAGIAGAVVAMLHGPFVFHGMKLLPIPLALATQALALLLLALARSRARPGLGLACGLAWGVACLARAEVLLFLPVVLGALAWNPVGSGGTRRYLPAAACLAGMALAIAPATAHNLRRGDAVLIASSGGENLFIGNQREADGGHTPLDPRAGDLFSQRLLARKIAEDERGTQLTASGVSAYWRGRALDEIRTRPGEWLRLEGRKLARLLHPGDPTDLYSFLLERDRFLGLLRALPLPAVAVWLPAFLGVGWVIATGRRSAWPLACFVALQAGVLLLFFVSTRLRLPWLFFLTPFAGLALVEATRAWRRGRLRGLSAGVGLLLAASIGWWSLVASPPVREVLRLASVLSMQGRLQESLAVLEPWTREPAPDPLALDQAGWVHQKGGRLSPAERLYLRALEAGLPDGREAQTRTRLGRVYADLGRPDAARVQYDEAVRLAPDRGGPRYERAVFLLQRGDRRGAVRDLWDAARLEPGWSAPLETLRSLGETSPPPGDEG